MAMQAELLAKIVRTQSASSARLASAASSSRRGWASFGLWSTRVPEHVTTRNTQRVSRDAYMQVIAGKGGGHHRGCARLAPTMQAGQD